MKKIISILSAVIMCLCSVNVSFAAEIKFSDVKKSDWFYDDVKTAVESGLINGKGADSYAPDDNLTYAEAIKLAACMNQLYKEGKITLTSGNPWYKPYVDYCVNNGIITKEYNPGENATRAGYMEIFANSLPAEALKEINNVPDNSIPDVPSSRAYAVAVYKLYRAGILTGIDKEHNCDPTVFISRKEVASIVARMMYENKRAHFNIIEDREIVETDKNEENDNAYSSEEQYNTYDVMDFQIGNMPTDMTVKCGETATFSTSIMGGERPYAYRWQYLENSQWTDFEDKTDEEMTVNGAAQNILKIEMSVAGVTEIRCIITDNSGNSLETKTVKLIVEEKNITDENATEENSEYKDSAIIGSQIVGVYYTEMQIETQPNATSVSVGKTAKFTVKVVGGKKPYSYQWQNQVEVVGKMKWQDLKNIKGICSGTKTEELSFTSEVEGEMLLRCVITDEEGNVVTTDPVKLAVTEKKTVLPSRINPF